MASATAAGSAYATHGEHMIPVYLFYSMFGFQRTGDSIWAMTDQLARGFLIGGTSGRTTLNGEGLQHEDGHSHIQSLTIPNCISYDPAFAYEVAVIMHDGLVRMYGEAQENVYYYITTLNENYHMPAMPQGAEEGIRKGIYKLETVAGSKGKVQLLGSGSILRHVREASQILAKDYGITREAADAYAVRSHQRAAAATEATDLRLELRRDRQVEGLVLVVVFLLDRLREVEAQRADRRGPEQRYADRRPHLHPVVHGAVGELGEVAVAVGL